MNRYVFRLKVLCDFLDRCCIILVTIFQLERGSTFFYVFVFTLIKKYRHKGFYNSSIEDNNLKIK